jgi:hypothetical protein
MSHYDDYNEKHSFTFRFDSNDGEVHLEMSVNELYIQDVLDRFREFLLGCGYQVNGEIDIVEYNSEQDHDSGYTLTEPPKHEPKFDFSNVPNNNWPFGSLKPEPIPALTTADLSGITVTDLSTLTTHSYGDWSGVNKYATMAPLTSEQIYSWSTEMPGTIGGAKVSRGNYGNDAY